MEAFITSGESYFDKEALAFYLKDTANAYQI